MPVVLLGLAAALQDVPARATLADQATAPAPDAAAAANASDVIVTATRAPTSIDKVVSNHL